MRTHGPRCHRPRRAHDGRRGIHLMSISPAASSGCPRLSGAADLLASTAGRPPPSLGRLAGAGWFSLGLPPRGRGAGPPPLAGGATSPPPPRRPPASVAGQTGRRELPF